MPARFGEVTQSGETPPCGAALCSLTGRVRSGGVTPCGETRQIGEPTLSGARQAAPARRTPFGETPVARAKNDFVGRPFTAAAGFLAALDALESASAGKIG